MFSSSLRFHVRDPVVTKFLQESMEIGAADLTMHPHYHHSVVIDPDNVSNSDVRASGISLS